MAENWAADVKKFVPDADDTVIAAIVRYCGIALHNRDSSLVSMTDPVETGRVRENFLKKKLGLTHADEVLDGAIAAVGERMKGVNFKNRVTVYYLLLEHFGLLHLFGGKPGGVPAADVGAGLGVAGAAALGVAGLGGGGAGLGVGGAGDDAASSIPSPPIPPIPPAAAPATAAADVGATALYDTPEEGSVRSGGGWWWLWLLLALLLLALLWWLFWRPHGPAPEQTPIAAENAVLNAADNAEIAASVAAAAAGVDLSAAPAEGTVAIPTGAGVTSEMRDGKPVVKVYFDTGKTDVAPAFAAAAGGLKAYLASHGGTSLAVSGYNDMTGNAAANAELSKDRAKAVQAALVSAGIAEGTVALVKPEQTTDTSTSNEAARRVEVVVK